MFATATLIGSASCREYEFLVDPGHVYIGLPQSEIKALGLESIPRGKIEMRTATGTIEQQIYWSIGRIDGRGFVATVIPASIALIGHQFLDNHGFRVSPVTETIERVPDEEFGPPYMVSQWPV